MTTDNRVSLFALPPVPERDPRTPARREVQARVLRALRAEGPRSADELADLLGLDVLSTRPACTVLKNDGLVYKTREFAPRKTDLGRRARRYALTAFGEREPRR